MAHLTVLTWNIDGLSNELFLAERLMWVLETAKTHRTSIVCFQEVIPDILSIAVGAMKSAGYVCVQPDRLGPYFNLLFVRTDAYDIISSRTIVFRSSQMGRHAIVCRVRAKGVAAYSQHTATIITSHLESTGPAKAERISQLKQAFDVMAQCIPADSVVVFCGDMNLRDSEINGMPSASRPDGLFDAWEAHGSVQKTKYTWDMSINKNLAMNGTPKCRFDRVFVLPAQRPTDWRVHNFSLVGTEAIENLAVHPSDHFGVLVDLVHAPAAPIVID